MKKFYQNPILRFLALAGTLYFTWLIIYYYIIKIFTNWDYYLDYNIVWFSQKLLNLFGVQSLIDVESSHVLLYLMQGDYRPILVGDECNGFKLFSIFIIFIVSFPGKWRHKAWFIPVGILLIHFANVIRVSALMMINNYYPEYLDFNHLYTFTIFVYGIIFLLWYWYIKRYSTYVEKS